MERLVAGTKKVLPLAMVLALVACENGSTEVIVPLSENALALDVEIQKTQTEVAYDRDMVNEMTPADVRPIPAGFEAEGWMATVQGSLDFDGSAWVDGATLRLEVNGRWTGGAASPGVHHYDATVRGIPVGEYEVQVIHRQETSDGRGILENLVYEGTLVVPSPDG